MFLKKLVANKISREALKTIIRRKKKTKKVPEKLDDFWKSLNSDN